MSANTGNWKLTSFSSTMHSTSETNPTHKISQSPFPSAPPPPSQHYYPPSSSNNNTTLQFEPKHPVPWSTGLCDCLDDIHTCCLTCWCPCVTFGRIAEMVDRGATSCGVSAALYALILCVTGCSCLYSCFYRSKLRGQYFLEESPCTDCCIHCCCEECALCQEYRQLKHHGYDMSIGWHGNMERLNRLKAISPVVQERMSRQV